MTSVRRQPSVYRRKRKIGRLILALDRENVGGRQMRELYVAFCGHGFYVGWASHD